MSMKVDNFFLLLLILLQNLKSFTDAQTTTKPLTAGSGSGAGPIDDEDLGRPGSGDRQPSGLAAPPSTNSSRLVTNAISGGGAAVTRLALPTLLAAGQPMSTAGTPALYTAWHASTTSAPNYVPCSYFLTSQAAARNSPLPPEAPGWLDGRGLLPRKPSCSPQQPDVYNVKQCLDNGNNNCFCVDSITGRQIVGTEASANMFASRSCKPLTFSVTVGFRDQWDPKLMIRGSPRFRELADKIKNVIDSIYYSYAGNQTSQLLRFRSGSILADLILTSVGHPAELSEDPHQLKNLLDNRLRSSGANLITGLQFDPTLYRFQAGFPGHGDGSDWQGLNSGQSLYDARNLKQDMYKTTPSAEAGAVIDGSDSLVPSPAILGAIVGGGIGALALVILLIVFCVYRIRKADEGSYSLDPAKKAANVPAYEKAPSREFYA